MLDVSQVYPTDLSNKEWRTIQSIIKPEKRGGRRREVDIRTMVNALLYRERTRCAWRLLPNNFPHWRTVYEYFTEWQKDHTWDKIRDTLNTLGRKNI